MKKRKTISPLLTVYYANNNYTDSEINFLESLLSDDEFQRYEKMKWNTNKQAFFAISTLIDIYSLKK